MGYALGVLGMSYDDFCRCTLSQFRATVKARRDHDEATRREAWERARWHAAATIQPHLSRRIDMREALPLPWDNAQPQRPKLEVAQLTKEERLAAATDAIARVRRSKQS